MVRFLSIVVAVISLVLLPRLVNADALSWTSTNPVVESKSSVGTGSGWKDACQERYKSIAQVVDVQGDGSPGSYKTDCVVGDGANYTLYSYSSFRRLAIKFDGDIAAHTIYGVICQSSCIYMPSRDTLVVVDHINYFGAGEIDMYKNFVSKLKLNDSLEVYNRSYTYDQSPDQTISSFDSDSPGYIGLAKSVQRSSNDKWLVAEFVGIGLVRIDMDNLQMLKFSDWGTEYSHGKLPTIEFDISNDGQHIAVFGKDTLNRIFDITSSCGNLLPNDATYADLAKQQVTPCPWVLAANGPAIGNDVVDNPSDMFLPRFSDDGGEISFVATSYDASISPLRVTMRAANYTGPPQLDYLALGDSYSSGEGDNDRYGINYYRKFTDIPGDASRGIPQEKCHVSTRSYPYLLALKMGLGADGSKRWDTVACSGAETRDIYDGRPNDYLGQYGRLKGYSAEALKTQALNEFIPGRQEQIEFVKKYKPKVITLTIGGNDVEFGNKIKACVSGFNTCEYANAQRPDMAGEIKNQYGKLVKLYNDLYLSSDKKAKIYVLSYPQFINGDNDAICNRYLVFLDTAEREMIQNSVTYLNNVIKEAARSTGVKYVDIEDSLKEHRLCDDGEKYVEGANFRVGTAVLTDYGSFHPNAKGHRAIAERVWSVTNQKSLVDYIWCSRPGEMICPDPTASKENIVVPPYYKDVAWQNSFYKQMTGFDQFINGTVDIIVGAYTFGANVVASITGHSTPVDLGKYMTDSDGSLKATFKLPSSMEAGYHTIEITGTSYTGDPIKYEQTIFIKGQNPEDSIGGGFVGTNGTTVGADTEGRSLNISGEQDKSQNQDTKYLPVSHIAQRGVNHTEQVDAKLLIAAFVLFAIIAMVKIYNKLMIK